MVAKQTRPGRLRVEGLGLGSLKGSTEGCSLKGSFEGSTGVEAPLRVPLRV